MKAYTRPQLHGHSAVETIQTTGEVTKFQSQLEAGSQTKRTQPAYEADE